MSSDYFNDVLEGLGFDRVGTLSQSLEVGLWWHSSHHQQLAVIRAGSVVLLKGTKPYHLVSVSNEGRTWARDIPALHRYLEGHFPEVHLSFAHYRDLTGAVVQDHLERGSRSTPNVSVSRLEQLQARLAETQAERRSTESLRQLNGGDAGLLGTHLRRSSAQSKQEAGALQDEVAQARSELDGLQHLQREYLRKGSAASLLIQISSSLQIAASQIEFTDAAKSIVKELSDYHRFQINQKLNGGKLNIQVEKAKQPITAWLETWLTGALSPRDLDRLEPHLGAHRKTLTGPLFITPDEDIVVDGTVKEDKKLLGARVMSGMIQRLDSSSHSGVDLSETAGDELGAWFGSLAGSGHQGTRTPCCLPIARLNHVYISGTTGSGKSYGSRVLVEEAAQLGLDVLVLDPRNQSAGLLVPEDRRRELGLYEAFGMPASSASGFDFDYYGPGMGLDHELPGELGSLAEGRSIVSFKGLDDQERCDLLARILTDVFERASGAEAAMTRRLIVVEEAQNFTKKRVGKKAKAAGQAAEMALDRLVREGRKYGICTVIISQAITDFSHDSASIRQNTNTKIFFRNTDRELEYAAPYLGDSRQLVSLVPGTCVAHNPYWGSEVVRVRPPRSKVWEFGEDEMRRLLGGDLRPLTLSAGARALLGVVNGHRGDQGEPLNLSAAGELMGLTSRRKLHALVEELEAAGAVRTRKLRERGQPRVIEAVWSGDGPNGGQDVDEMRTKEGQNR